MTPDRRERLAEILAAVADMGESERSAYLDDVCRNEPDLRQEIESGLADTLGIDAADAPRPPAAIPESVGPYKVLRQIGEGGMGVVYLAQQEEPIRRKVALKLVKLGMDTDLVIARFEAERQALAMMNHPSIAQVFDAGNTDAGRPYFVMEYVEGTPVTQHCDQHRLDPHDRLRLFASVCRAIQHAHTKGVIHRDIKPSNVLVFFQDGEAVPKVIDFGVARAIEQHVLGSESYTVQGQILGTPDYMSPEQSDMTGLDIDTRTDVYSLGVLLYELLTGVLPFDPSRLRSEGIAGMQRIIREESPATPSSRITQLGAEAPSVARLRSSELSSLVRELRGELDWIVLRGMEKDRARRYQSPSEFADDIENYLADRPVHARPPSVAYRARKFVSRYSALVTAATIVLLTLVAGLIVSSVLFVRAERSRQELLTQNYVANIRAADAAVRENRITRAREFLEDCPPTRRGWEWDHLQAKLDDSIGVLEGHRGEVRGVAISPDQRWIASAGNDSTLRIWNLEDRSLVRILRGHEGSVTAVDFHPDGARVVSASMDSTVRIWAVPSGECVSILRGHRSTVASAAYSPDGTEILSGTFPWRGAEEVILWDAESGGVRRRIEGSGVGPLVAFDPSGERFATGGGGTPTIAKIFDTETGERVVSMGQWLGMSWGLCYNASGSRLATAKDEPLVRFWDPETGDPKAQLATRGEAAYSLAWYVDRRFDRDGDNRILIGEIGAITLWSGTWEVPGIFRGHESTVSTLAAGRGLFTSGGADGDIRIWDPTFANGALILPFRGGDSVTFSQDGRLVASARQGDLGRWWRSGEFGAAKIWDADSGQLLWLLRSSEIQTGFARGISAVAFARNDTCLVAGSASTGRLELFSLESRQVIEEFIGHRGPIHSLSVHPNELQMASASADSTVRIWDLESTVLRHLFELPAEAQCVDFSPDGTTIAAGAANGSVFVWDATNGRVLTEFTRGNRVAYDLAYDPNGRDLAVGFDDGVVWVLDLAAGETRHTLAGHGDGATSVAYSPNGSRIATGGEDFVVRVWDSGTGESLVELDDHQVQIASIAFSPDGQSLAGGSTELVLWKRSGARDDFDRRREAARGLERATQLVDSLGGSLPLGVSIEEWIHSHVTEASVLPTAVAISYTVALTLNNRCWEVVRLPDRPDSLYQAARLSSEEAVRLDPSETVLLNTLGVSQYRCRRFEESVRTLAASDSLLGLEGVDGDAADVAFLAMALLQSGRVQEADAARDRFRTIMQRTDNDPESLAFSKEVSELFEARGR